MFKIYLVCLFVLASAFLVSLKADTLTIGINILDSDGITTTDSIELNIKDTIEYARFIDAVNHNSNADVSVATKISVLLKTYIQNFVLEYEKEQMRLLKLQELQEGSKNIKPINIQ